MAVEAAVVQYREAMVDQFEQNVSILRYSMTKESMTKGNQATFLVAGSGTDTAVTRGVNGQIPYGNPTNTQSTATLVEKHAPYELTNFNIFSSQGDQKAIMRKASMAVINRDIDIEILSVLSGATIDTGTATTGSINMVMSAQAELGVNDVPVEDEDNMFAVITPAFRAYLMQTTEFSSGDYVEFKSYSGAIRKMWRWAGINWMVSARITNIGTNNELCYMYHRDSMGFACNMGEESIAIGYDEKQDSSWSRSTIYRKALRLQNSGIVQMKHDGSAYQLS